MRHHKVGLVALLLCALLTTACGSTTGGGGPAPTPTVGPGGTISATILLPGTMSDVADVQIAASDTAVWVRDGADGTVIRIDPTTNKVVTTISVGRSEFGSLAAGPDAVWVVNHDNSTVSRIDPHTNTVVATIALPPPNGQVFVTPGAVWVTSLGSNTLRRIDPQTNTVVATIPNFGKGPQYMAFDAGSLWVCNHRASSVTRLDPAINQAQGQIDIGGSKGFLCDGIGAMNGAVWALLRDPALDDNNEPPDTIVARLDPATNQVQAQVAITAGTDFGPVIDAYGVWIVDPELGLFRIDPQANRVVGVLADARGSAVATGAGSVWVVEPGGGGTVLRITPAA